MAGREYNSLNHSTYTTSMLDVSKDVINHVEFTEIHRFFRMLWLALSGEKH